VLLRCAKQLSICGERAEVAMDSPSLDVEAVSSAALSALHFCKSQSSGTHFYFAST